MSVCPKPEEYSAYVDGEFSGVAEKNLTEHLSKCKKCQAIVEDYVNLKAVLSLDETPEIELEKSFDSLMLKRKLKKLKTAYVVFNILRKNIKIEAMLFGISVLVLVSYFSISQFYLKNENTITKINNVEFIPILPVSRRVGGRIQFNDMNLREMNIFLNISKKNSINRYSNFTNTFYNFTQLYSHLNDNDALNGMTEIKIDNSYFYQSATSSSIYANLSENEK